ncbi:MAG: DUF615 domain-containing protein [Deltaproteobacteria bacterium]|nr:DUF615 domain-containing protein [Deltaproteobacteria bacterium]
MPSRSQRKRDSLALQRVGEALTRCSDAALAGLPLSDALRQAVTDWKRIPSREGKRRQLQYIGRLMRKEEESEALIAALGGGDAA